MADRPCRSFPGRHWCVQSSIAVVTIAASKNRVRGPLERAWPIANLRRAISQKEPVHLQESARLLLVDARNQSVQLETETFTHLQDAPKTWRTLIERHHRHLQLHGAHTLKYQVGPG